VSYFWTQSRLFRWRNMAPPPPIKGCAQGFANHKCSSDRHGLRLDRQKTTKLSNHSIPTHRRCYISLFALTFYLPIPQEKINSKRSIPCLLISCASYIYFFLQAYYVVGDGRLSLWSQSLSKWNLRIQPVPKTKHWESHRTDVQNTKLLNVKAAVTARP
jgi:hypothetical protein